MDHGVILSGAPAVGSADSLRSDPLAPMDFIMTPTRLVLATLLIAAAPAAFANTAQVNVTGTITPVACRIALANAGNFDLGEIKATELDSGSTTKRPTQSTDFSVECDAAVRFAMTAIDMNEADNQNASDAYFSLGKTTSGESMGHYLLYVQDATAGSDALYRTYSADGGLVWTRSSSTAPTLDRKRLISWTTVEGSSAGPTAIQQLSASLDLYPYIAPTSGLSLTEDQQINGGVVLTVKYL